MIIADDADLARSVDNIMLGKTTNAGQICVAPDYVLLPQAKVATSLSFICSVLRAVLSVMVVWM